MCELALRQRRHIDSWGLQGSAVTARAPAVAATQAPVAAAARGLSAVPPGLLLGAGEPGRC